MFKLATQKTKDTMRFTLILPTGETMKFYILELAQTYQATRGGILLDEGRPMLKLVA